MAEVQIDETMWPPDDSAPDEADILNTHGIFLDFGKHKGEHLTRIPVSYVRWMANQEGLDPAWRALAKAEHERRGNTYPTIELTGHAIDNASLRCRKIWHETRNEDEGLYSWLMRVTLEAIEKGERLESGKIRWKSMKFVIQEGEEFPILKTIMT